MSNDIRWIRSYVLQRTAARSGQRSHLPGHEPEAIREHASRADLPVDEIIPVAGTVVVRPDPEAATV